MNQHRPTAEELTALQPTAEDIQEIEEIEGLQVIARRYLDHPEEVQRVRPAAMSILSAQEYLGLYAALAFREWDLPETTGALAEENLYRLCVDALTRSKAGDIPGLPDDAQPVSFSEEPVTKPADEGTGRFMADAAVYEGLTWERGAMLAEKDREIARLTKALEETQAALLRQEQDHQSRMEALIALHELQHTDLTLPEEESVEKPAEEKPAEEKPAEEKLRQSWWRRRKEI